MVASLRPGRIIRKRVEIFHEGDHVDSAGKPFHCTAGDLEDTVRNFSILSTGERPILEPPIGIDHDTAVYIPDELIGNSKLNMGEVVRLYTETQDLDGKATVFLFADLALEPKTDMLIAKGYLTGVSSEFPSKLPDGAEAVGAKGMILRRLALLGSDLPALKRLKRFGSVPEVSQAARLQPARFSEHHPITKTRVKQLTEGGAPAGVAFFCEMSSDNFEGANSMDRTAMLARLQELGYDVSKVTDAVGDEWLAEMIAVLEENAKLKKDLEAAGAKPAEGGMSDKGGTGREPKQVTMRYSEADLQRAVGRITAPLVADLKAKIDADNASRDTDAKNRAALDKVKQRADIFTFTESMVAEGKMRSADIERDKDGVPHPLTELASLYRAADVISVHSFSEAGATVQKTALECEMARIKARPKNLYKFSERVQAQKPGTEGTVNRFEKIREQARDSRKTPAHRKTLNERMGILPASGNR